MPHRGMVLGGRSGHFLRSHRFACGQRPSKHQKAAMQCNTLSCSTNRGLPKRKSRWHFSTGTVNGISVHQARDMRCTNAAIHEMCNGAGGVHSRWLSEVRTERRVGHCIAGRAGGEGIAGGCIALQGVALNCVARRSMAGQAGPGPGWARDCTALHCTAPHRTGLHGIAGSQPEEQKVPGIVGGRQWSDAEHAFRHPRSLQP
mmetsp:Transcript_83293/g.138972  ORF Transcript_83293/g.138972 Transcript_83293/m.138972 type:complete len:202 (-) Transcript_83293:1472-2077(-)